MVTATMEDPRKFRGKSLAERLWTIIVSAYPGRHGVKRLAADAEVSARTAENWWSGDNLPGVGPLLRLMAAHPELQDQINVEVALLRRAHASQQSARTSLHETNDRHGAATHRMASESNDRHAAGATRAVDAAALDMARKQGDVADQPRVAHERV